MSPVEENADPPAVPTVRPVPEVSKPVTERERMLAGDVSKPAVVRGHNAADFWALMGCNAIVFAASVCIMVLELTASRLIAVHLGASLYTWTSVIGVVLAGISFGNYLGGWLADRHPPRKTLAWLFLVAGLLTFSVLWLNQWAAKEQRPDWMGWEGWVVFVVAWIFLLPALALGTISPVTASMALTRSSRTGMTVGNVYAWGALGSIVGTFLAGFYLIDMMGTKMIIVATALTLLSMAVLVAAGQWAFRACVFFGAMQFVSMVGLCAAADKARGEEFGRFLAIPWAAGLEDPQRGEIEEKFANWGERIGRTLHDLGELLSLRSDDPLEYNDESNYFSINIAGGEEDGALVKRLKLDHLLHSYYNPDEPTVLYYDYEKVYAAITERVAGSWQRKTETPLERYPGGEDFLESLPPRITYDAARKRLIVDGAMDFAQFRKLLGHGDYGKFWLAMLSVSEQSQKKGGDFATAPLESLPEDVHFPAPPKELMEFTPEEEEGGTTWKMPRTVHYDPHLEAIVCSGRLELPQAIKLMEQGEDRAYLAAVYDLYQRSRRVSTMFIGGGGFVFPRWIETLFPHDPIIDVAEIDPAVKLAVQREMGLPDDDKTHVRTHIGDARHFVDECLRRNAALEAQQQTPLRYDFIYGDAFNDFSVPWHLTTLEFTQRVEKLLTPGEGVYLVNIIDIYPRAEYPAETAKAEYGDAVYEGSLPDALRTGGKTNAWGTAPGKFRLLEIREEEPNRRYQFRFQSAMTEELRDQLRELVRGDSGEYTAREVRSYREGIQSLYKQTNARKVYEAAIPPALLPAKLEELEWTDAPAPYQNFQVKLFDDTKYLVGFRGVMSTEMFEILSQVAPGDEVFQRALRALARTSYHEKAGAFLGRYVNTVRDVFPCVYVFSGNEANQGAPGDSRDTFVVACALRKLDMENLYSSGRHWRGRPFAATERNADGTQVDSGQMDAILQHARGLKLTDDFAPVDNLLAPVFVRQ